MNRTNRLIFAETWTMNQLGTISNATITLDSGMGGFVGGIALGVHKG
jgi:hypothetical protein